MKRLLHDLNYLISAGLLVTATVTAITGIVAHLWDLNDFWYHTYAGYAMAVFALALAFPMRLTLAVGLVSAFGFFHGFVHIAELPAEAAGTVFTGGMLAGTALLHAIGLAIGLAIAARRPRLA